MVATKGGSAPKNSDAAGAGLTNPIHRSRTTAECCMCGDYGLSQELFRCKICKSRFQHKYCSNQYPKAESYKACNWCLSQKYDPGNSSNSNRKDSGDDRREDTVKNERNPNDGIGNRGLRERRKASEMELTTAGLIKKVHGLSPEEESPESSGRKKVGGGVVQEKNHAVLRKSKSANHLSNTNSSRGMKARPVFRSKVRRYKLLEEVSS